MATPTFYIFHGDDDFHLDQKVDELRAQMREVDSAGLNIADLDGEGLPPGEAIAAASAFPFLADRRLVFVRGMLRWYTRKGAGQTGKDAVDFLIDNLPNLPDYARLVFVERGTLPKNSRLLKLAQEQPNGYEMHFAAPKNLTQWLMRRAQDEYAVEMQSQAAVALDSVLGGDLRRADNELLKLASYTGGAPITEADVAALTPYTPETNLFAMVDALANGRGEQAMALLHGLLDDPKEDPFRLWGMVVRQFRLLLLAKEHLTSGGSPGELATALGISPFAAKKLPAQARGFTIDQLEAIYRRLLEYDLMMKTGGISANLALDMLVAGLARS